MKNNTQTSSCNIAFVDPYSSTHYLASHVKAAGIKITAIYTGNLDNLQDPKNYISIHPEYFDHVLYLPNNDALPALIETLKTLQIERVYYGSEKSVNITDQIANKLSVAFANSGATSEDRYNKFAMQEALRTHDIPAVKQMKIQDKKMTKQQEQELSTWSFPVFIKPVNDAAFLGARACSSLQEIKDFLPEQADRNVFDNPLTDFVVQEFLEGAEYFVDTFSSQGKHYISGVQKYHRIFFQNVRLPVYAGTVSPETEEYKVCVKYVEQVLTAVGFKNGLAHTEIMLTKNGPFLLEVNPRISGASGTNIELFQLCGYPTQVDFLIADCLGQVFPAPKQLLYGRKLCLQNYKKRIISDLNWALLETLPSFKKAYMLKTPGTEVSLPASLFDIIAFVFLVHPDKKILEADCAQVLAWESSLQLF